MTNESGPNPEQEEYQKELLRKYDSLGSEFKVQLAALRQPLAHGTTSEALESILQHGLGARMPENSFAGSKSATDLKVSDGLLGAYVFARMDPSELKIRSEKLTGEDAISRYGKLNPKIDEVSLREKFEAYRKQKNPQGYPVLLIYEGGDKTKVQHHNPRVPSEVELEESVSSKNLRTVLVPQSRLEEVARLLKSLKLQKELKPIEILEIVS